MHVLSHGSFDNSLGPCAARSFSKETRRPNNSKPVSKGTIKV